MLLFLLQVTPVQEVLKFIVKNADVEQIWNKVFEAGAAYGKPIGLAARDTLRLEMGLVCTEMTLTTRLLHLKQDWVGLLNSQKSLRTRRT
jgi:glycine cleavage system aminomethyltransferase T